jgi:VanZ family protein
MAFIFGLSSIHHTPDLAGGADKDLHAVLYGGLAVLLVRALARQWPARVTAAVALTATLLAAAYGVSDEMHQRFVPPRQSDPYDVAADATGAAIAAFGLYALRRPRARGRIDAAERV